jgi:hypothetical protein
MKNVVFLWGDALENATKKKRGKEVSGCRTALNYEIESYNVTLARRH